MPSEKNIARARRGAAWLDQKLGPGWRRKIRRRNLNMAEGGYIVGLNCGCILAQLDADRSGSGYGYYGRGVEELGVTTPVRLGFVADRRAVDTQEEYDDLTQAWREVLQEPVS